MGRTAKRSAIAIVSACVWALFALFAHMAARPAGEAHAAEGAGPNTLITVMAESPLGMVGGGVEYEWGYFYRGIEMLAESHYKADGINVNAETITWSELDSDGDTYSLGLLEGEKNPLYGEGDSHTHYFTDDTKITDKTDNGHYVKCTDCDFQLEVAHRPQADGTCFCGATLGGYENTFTFLVPDAFPDEGGEWTEENVATIEIPVNAHLFFGCTLTLFLNCDGLLTSEMGETVSYTIEVEYEDERNSFASEVEYPPLSCDGSDEAIWVYTSSNADSMDEADVMALIAGTIIITLTVDVSESALSDLTYAGEFTGELTFTAKLEEANDEG